MNTRPDEILTCQNRDFDREAALRGPVGPLEKTFCPPVTGKTLTGPCALVRMLALGLEGGRVMLVDEATGEEKWAVQAHSRLCRLTEVAMSEDGRYVASAGIHALGWTLWEAASGVAQRVGARHDGNVVSGSNPLYQRSGSPIVLLVAMALSSCGQRIATAGGDGAVILWNTQTGEVEHRMQGYSISEITSLSFSERRERLACVYANGAILVWDATMGTLLRAITAAHGEYASSVSFSPMDTRILVSVVRVGAESDLHFWKVDSGTKISREKIRSIEGFDFAVFSPDGRSIASKGRSHELCIIGASSGAIRAKWRLRLRIRGDSSSASFSVDGSKLASGSSDGTCKVWDSSTGELLQTINVKNPVLSVAWGGDWDLRMREAKVGFAMGQHPRLGAGSQVLELEAGVFRMIMDRV